MNCSPPGSFVHGILQVRILEWVVISSSRGSSWLRVRTGVSCIACGFFTIWATREAQLCVTYWLLQYHFLLNTPKVGLSSLPEIKFLPTASTSLFVVRTTCTVKLSVQNLNTSFNLSLIPNLISKQLSLVNYFSICIPTEKDKYYISLLHGDSKNQNKPTSS